MRISFVATVYNEELTIKPFLESIFSQSKFPDEIIIVDGGSTDNTVSEISSFKFPKSKMNAKIKLIFKKGNRAVGRNEAIKNSSNEIIICSDAGCILDKEWAQNITKPFKNPQTDVVAGYYKGISKTVFQKCLIPYVLVMPDKVDEENFLPATRSMAFKKTIWRKAGNFPEEFSNNEDYVFSRRLKKANAKIVFARSAVVGWMPRENIRDAFVMFYRFARGDSESQIVRPKVVLLIIRYLIALSLLFLFALMKSYSMLIILLILFFAYVIWAIIKNYKHVNNIAALYYLPALQITSDIAVILGTLAIFDTQLTKRCYN